MLLRKDGDGIVAISQPAHAWISGQLARSWGNERFGRFAPEEEVCLAAEQHDIGFLEWEQVPTLDLKTGLPHSFMAMPLETHLQIWSRSVQDIMAFSRYAAWLVSLHVTRLCQRHLKHARASESDVLETFLQEQTQIRAGLRESLLQKDTFAALCQEKVVERNRQLVATWDWMSLLLLQGFSDRHTVTDVPAAEGYATLTLQADTARESVFDVRPWPFQTGQVELRCDGKQLSGRFSDQSAMRAGLRAASPITVAVHLLPGRAT
jgi:hypothetical protein